MTSRHDGSSGSDTLPVRDESLVDAWRAIIEKVGERPGVSYFDASFTLSDVEQRAEALAAELQDRGVRRGDRVGIYLQNVPAYVFTLLALWKCGAAAVLLNPMYRKLELRKLVEDSRPVGMVCAASAREDLQADLAGTSVSWFITAQERQETADITADALDAILDRRSGSRPAPVEVGPDDIALLTYTSGTTGPPKGAMNTHRNVLAAVDSYAALLSLDETDVVLAVAPIFHITGAVINATISLLTGCQLVLIDRFRPDVAVSAIAEHGVTFAIGSITAFNAIDALPDAGPAELSSLRLVYSGGAPIPPSTVTRFRERFGVYIHNVYGMTETSSAVIAVPPNTEAPVHGPSGMLSVGRPLPNVDARVVGPDGDELPPGTQGELVIAGPQVVPGYWKKPEISAAAIPGGVLRTGDGAVMDEDSWIYLVDRLKDQINVSGYKVWPREVEDSLYEHSAVHEAAVVGRPDDYQGESVVAYVSLRARAEATEQELIAHVRDRLAAYKVPKEVHVVDDLPKTQSGKIRRNVLRDRETTGWETGPT
ncbi:class I adenylate-forming enzyme family protein [Saccharopolyspora sp. ASAGF58]|uniref:class I adenylate-forming enzyme family protein n=1 Tax=Saccharopolyspora sp. ASAGF58 TaxID=2719023 RepID=UPI0014402033|nr:AMP-binding protein [Saccharopolyspora sp. ASAGF58]QIZ38023.1 long-chain fatty acid--CoA ligase [Saccharopolyspora sp. ASAGF58]